MKLVGKSAVISGGASGIGAATVALFAQEGASVTIADVSVEGATLATTLRARGTDVHFVRTDMTEADQVGALFENHVKRCGGLDILFNNASTVGIPKPVVETSEAEVDHILTVNFKSVFLASKLAAPIMTGAGRGSIINTTAASAREGLAWANIGVYIASKGAVVAFTRALAVELSPLGVRVNSISPGVVDTPMTRQAAGRQPDPDQALSHMAGLQLLRRMAVPDELAKAALFLASDDSSYVTGTDLLVDGGLVLGSG